MAVIFCQDALGRAHGRAAACDERRPPTAICAQMDRGSCERLVEMHAEMYVTFFKKSSPALSNS